VQVISAKENDKGARESVPKLRSSLLKLLQTSKERTIIISLLLTRLSRDSLEIKIRFRKLD